MLGVREEDVDEVTHDDDEESVLSEVSKAFLIDEQGWRRVPQVEGVVVVDKGEMYRVQ